MTDRQVTVSLFTLALVLPACSGLLIGDLCSEGTTCPLYSECIVNECNRGNPELEGRPTCTCVKGYYPLENRKGCETVVDRQQPCDMYRVCRRDSICLNGRCACVEGYRPSWDGRRCKPRFSGTPRDNPTFMAVLDEPCDAQITCYDQFGNTECRDGRCRCKAGFRPRMRMDRISHQVMALADCLPESLMTAEAGYC